MDTGYLINKTTGQRTPILGRMIIGRATDADLKIDDVAASRKHAEVSYDSEGFICRDLGSRNGTLVNKERKISERLHSGDIIRIGKTDFIFKLEQTLQSAQDEQPLASEQETTENIGVREEQPANETWVGPAYDIVLKKAGFAGNAASADWDKSWQLFEALFNAATTLSAIGDPSQLLDQILATTLPMLHAQRGWALLSEDAKERMKRLHCDQTQRGLEQSGDDNQLAVPEAVGTLVSKAILKQVMQDGESLLLRQSEAPSEEDQNMQLQGSVICVPLRAQSNVLGMLHFDAGLSAHAFEEKDLLLASALGNSAGTALDQALAHIQARETQRMEQEQEIQNAVLEGFLRRDWKIDDNRLEAYGNTLQAGEAGGDLYDFMQITPDIIALLVGDVSGKGIPAVLTMARVLAQFRLLARGDASPAKVLSQLNMELARRNKQGLFCTLCCVRLDLVTGKLTWANAGHVPGMLINRNANIFFAEASGPPLGILEDAQWTDESQTLQPGSSVVFFTDGILEARSPEPPREEFGMERLKTTATYGMTPRQVYDAVKAAVNAHLGETAAQDDRTLLAMRYLGAMYHDESR